MRSPIDINQEVATFFAAQFSLCLESDDTVNETHSLYCAMIAMLVEWAHQQAEPAEAVKTVTEDIHRVHELALQMSPGVPLVAARGAH